MSTQIATCYEIVSRLPEDASVTFRDVSWDEYEELLEQVGEAPGLRVSYDNGSLQVMTISAEQEKYALFINSLIAGIRLRLRVNILSFGSATMRKRKLKPTPRRISRLRSMCIMTRVRCFQSTRRSKCLRFGGTTAWQ